MSEKLPNSGETPKPSPETPWDDLRNVPFNPEGASTGPQNEDAPSEPQTLNPPETQNFTVMTPEEVQARLAARTTNAAAENTTDQPIAVDLEQFRQVREMIAQDADADKDNFIANIPNYLEAGASKADILDQFTAYELSRDLKACESLLDAGFTADELSDKMMYCTADEPKTLEFLFSHGANPHLIYSNTTGFQRANNFQTFASHGFNLGLDDFFKDESSSNILATSRALGKNGWRTTYTEIEPYLDAAYTHESQLSQQFPEQYDYNNEDEYIRAKLNADYHRRRATYRRDHDLPYDLDLL